MSVRAVCGIIRTSQGDRWSGFFPLRVSLLSNTISHFKPCCWFENRPFWHTPFLKTPAPYQPAPALLAGAKMVRIGTPFSQNSISSPLHPMHLLLIRKRAVLAHPFSKTPVTKRLALLAGAKVGRFGRKVSSRVPPRRSSTERW